MIYDVKRLNILLNITYCIVWTCHIAFSNSTNGLQSVSNFFCVMHFISITEKREIQVVMNCHKLG